jgi:hypothetical protein
VTVGPVLLQEKTEVSPENGKVEALFSQLTEANHGIRQLVEQRRTTHVHQLNHHYLGKLNCMANHKVTMVTHLTVSFINVIVTHAQCTIF